eukprot:354208-Chlamydomonas_euryale.AAC.11
MLDQRGSSGKLRALPPCSILSSCGGAAVAVQRARLAVRRLTTGCGSAVGRSSRRLQLTSTPSSRKRFEQ